MGVGIFAGARAGGTEGDAGAFLYCTAAGWAFGPHFDSADDCTEFLRWTEAQGVADVRRVPAPELRALHQRWLDETRRT